MDLRIGQRYVEVPSQTLTDSQEQQLLLTHLQQQYANVQLQPHLKCRLQHRWGEEGQTEADERLNVLWQKQTCQHSAVASSEVKQRLQEFVLKKQQAALKQTDPGSSPHPRASYNPPGLFPQDPVSPQPSPSPAYERLLTTSGESPGVYPLRKTASEPNLKLRLKLKQRASERRRSPLLRRKDSAPASLRKRTPETRDPSPIDSRNSSGISSPNDEAPTENGTALSQNNNTPENSLAHRLLMREGSLLRLGIPSAPSLPDISRGVPSAGNSKGTFGKLTGLTTFPSRLPVLEGPLMTGLSQVTYFPASRLEGEAGLARLHPVVILEPSMRQSPLLPVPGLGAVPVFYAHPLLTGERYAPRISKAPQHRPLGRTRSAPLPQSPRSVQHQLHTQQQHQRFLERLKQQTHLGKLMLKRRMAHEEEEEAEAERNHSRVSKERQWQSHEKSDEGAQRQGSWEETEEERLQTLLGEQSWIRQLHQPPHMEALGVPYAGPCHRPLSRARSSPASASLPTPVAEEASKTSFTTGIVYDSLMLKHQCTCGSNEHPEHAGRIQSIWSRLQETGLRSQCECIRGRKATLEELQSVHTEQHVLLYGTNPLSRLRLDSRKLLGSHSQRTFLMLPCGGLGVDSDTVWNEMHSSSASRMAVGCVVELAFKVASEQLKNGFAIVRPPGHHAEPSTAMGFCVFNSIAIAAKQLLQKANVKKILIVDWDVHHGNGTQQIFYADPNVLYLSLHRHDDGNFFPGSGSVDEVGSGPGEGFNINIAWTGGLDPPMGDAEYLAAFRTVVIPVANEFAPDVVLVSSGFDAVEGHAPQLGGYKVSAKCFGHLTQQLMTVSDGRLVLVLEGGHDLTAICDASEACVAALLGKELDSLPEQTMQQRPNSNSVQSLERVIRIQSQYWKSIRRSSQTVGLSLADSRTHDQDESETVNALASLSVRVTAGQVTPTAEEPMDDQSSV